MKIKVKYKEIEYIIEDSNNRIDTNYNLINYNQDYIIRLIKEITENILKLKQ
jgi:hypothetical protein